MRSAARRLADASWQEVVAVGHDVHVGLPRRLVDAQDLVVVVVALLDLAVPEGDLALSRRALAHDHRALHLRADAIGIDGRAAVDSDVDARHGRACPCRRSPPRRPRRHRSRSCGGPRGRGRGPWAACRPRPPSRSRDRPHCAAGPCRSGRCPGSRHSPRSSSSCCGRRRSGAARSGRG